MAVRPGKEMRGRIKFTMIAVILCLTLVSSYSLVNIMVVKGDEYQSMASEQQLYDNVVTAPRGNIYDKNMKF